MDPLVKNLPKLLLCREDTVSRSHTSRQDTLVDNTIDPLSMELHNANFAPSPIPMLEIPLSLRQLTRSWHVGGSCLRTSVRTAAVELKPYRSH